MGHPLFQVDAFASEPFQGNPAAVCLLDAPADDAWMQNLAAEMNLSETAFVLKRPDGFQLRWFTPVTEVDLCGHATLASAHVLWQAGRLPEDQPARFHTKSGVLTANRNGTWIELDFPAQTVVTIDPPAGLAAALGVEGLYFGTDGVDHLVEIASEAELVQLKPDFTALRAFPVRGVMVTAASLKTGIDFVSRFFAPAAGIDEDPVTGSAHCSLGPFWSERLGKTALTGFQASRRGGIVKVAVRENRILLSGQAVTVFAGELAEGKP